MSNADTEFQLVCLAKALNALADKATGNGTMTGRDKAAYLRALDDVAEYLVLTRTVRYSA